MILCFYDTATTQIYTLSLHDALPIFVANVSHELKTPVGALALLAETIEDAADDAEDRKSTRLNSSHLGISYAVFCLKKKKSNGRDNARRAGVRAVRLRDRGCGIDVRG